MSFEEKSLFVFESRGYFLIFFELSGVCFSLRKGCFYGFIEAMNEGFNPTQILQDSLSDLGCQGALLAVSANGQITTYSAGTISAEAHNTPYYIYSISKTFTAVAVMKLCEEQGDFLDAPFVTFFPETTIPQDVTARQLLNHTSGLSDYFHLEKYQSALAEHPRVPWSYEELMKVGLEKTPLFKSGKGWAYSNPGYGLLRELIELKSGMNYYDYLGKIILQKIPLKDTRGFVERDHESKLLEGEDESFEGDFRPQYHPDWIATGCFISTVSDVAKFYDALFGGALLSQESVTEMLRTVDVLRESPEERIPSYGLGLMHFRKCPLGDSYGHGGGGPGYTTYATHFSNLKGNHLSVSLVLNKSMPQTPFDLTHEIVEHYLATHS